MYSMCFKNIFYTFLDTYLNETTYIRIVLVELDKDDNLNKSILLNTTAIGDVSYKKMEEYFSYYVCEIGAEIDVVDNTDVAVIEVRLCN